MKDRLKKKLKAKKILGNNKPQKPKSKSKPVKKKVYEMPDEYNEYLQKLTEMLEAQEEYKRMLPTLPPETRAEALPLIREYDKSLNEFEQKMADEYEAFQERERRIEESSKEADEAAAILYEHIQRGFILMKHNLPAESFKKFEKKWVGQMGKAEREEFYELVAHRESYDLENILADPNGTVRRSMKHPLIQLREARFEVDRVAYITGDEFKELEAEYENNLAIREKANKRLWIIDPEHRPRKRKQIEDLDRMLDEVKPKLMDFLEICFATDGKVEDENPDQKKLDAAFEQLDIASDRAYIMVKHTTPHLLEGFEKISFLDMTAEEIAETRARIARREAEELDKILASCKPPDKNSKGKK